MSPVSQSLHGLFLWTNSISLKSAEKWSIALLLSMAGALNNFKHTSASSLAKTHHQGSTNTSSDSSNCQYQSLPTSEKARATGKADTQHMLSADAGVHSSTAAESATPERHQPSPQETQTAIQHLALLYSSHKDAEINKTGYDMKPYVKRFQR